MAEYQLTTGTSIIRTSDGAMIPADYSNADYQVYRAWVVEGNTPDPIDQPTIEQQRVAINQQYSSRLQQLIVAKNQAEANGVSTTTVIARYAATQAEWKSKLQEIG